MQLFREGLLPESLSPASWGWILEGLRVVRNLKLILPARRDGVCLQIHHRIGLEVDLSAKNQLPISTKYRT